MLKLTRIPAIFIAGAVSGLAYPRFDIWPLIFVSVTAILLLLKGIGWRYGLLLGFTAGQGFYLSQIYWISNYLGPVPLIALTTLQALYFMVFGALMAILWRNDWLSRMRQRNLGKLLVAAAFASVWLAREFVAINLPYGGFPWSRLAMSQAHSPLADWVYWGGQPLLGFVIALSASLLAITVSGKKLSDLRLPEFTLPAALAVVLFAVPLATMPSTAAERGTITLAVVQGNAKAGLFANTVRGQIMQNHMNATKLAGSLDEVDLVVWPENAADVMPLNTADGRALMTTFVDDVIKKPLLFGTITSRGESAFNTSVLWLPGVGPTDFYDKKRPVAFAEYVPDRAFWRQFAPDLIDLIQRGYSMGEQDPIFNVSAKDADSGKAIVGVNICFEIAVDSLHRDAVARGAEILISQTNNADFGFSDETFQQAAIAKLRAIETGRVMVNDSTVGLTAVFMPDGTEAMKLPVFEPAAKAVTLPLRTSLTPAHFTAEPLEWVFNLATIGLFGFLAFRRLKKSGSGS